MTRIELEEAFKRDQSDLFRFGLKLMGIMGSPVGAEEEEGVTVMVAEEASEHDPVSPSSHYISLLHPFIFDKRKIPRSYKGFPVQAATSDASFHPEEFHFSDEDYEQLRLDELEDPQRYIDAVDRLEDYIRECLEDPSLTKKEMLDALAHGDFEKHKKDCEAFRSWWMGLGPHPWR